MHSVMLNRMNNRPFSNTPQRLPCVTVLAECTVDDEKKSSFCVAGIRMKKGDRSRMPLGDARDLERYGKARIVPDSEKTEML